MLHELCPAGLTSPVAWQNNQPIYREQLQYDVANVLAQLPEGDFAINRCCHRYAFMVAFLAVALKRQINVLPPNQLSEPLDDLAAELPGCVYCLQAVGDRQEASQMPTVQIDLNRINTSSVSLAFDSDAIAAQVYTSGSTGQPVANTKTWGSLLAGSQCLRQGLSGRLPAAANIVSTVPSQHMYGLETSVLLPLTHDVSIYAGRPFFPEDIRTALISLPAPRVLISTPIHLRACLKAATGDDFEWPELAGIYSSTGPLSRALAEQLGQQFNCPITEIYGTSETGALATCDTAKTHVWQLLPGMSLQLGEHGARVSGPQLSQDFALQDQLKLLSNHEFALMGRSEEVIKIAGKRVALGELNTRLNAIEGVTEGVFFVPDERPDDYPQRLLAVVVANTNDTHIRGQLAQHIDAVFLPRRIIRVAELPRNETGKLTRAALSELL